MASRIPTKSARCATLSSSSAPASVLGGRCEDHSPHDRQAIVAEEHVLRPAQSDPLGPEVASVRSVVAVVRVGADPETAGADLVGPDEQRGELGRWLGGRERNGSERDRALCAVDRDHVALSHDHVADLEQLVAGADPQGLGTDDRGLAPPAGHDGRVAHEAASTR